MSFGLFKETSFPEIDLRTEFSGILSLMTEKRLTTAVIGSYPQPPWLVDHEVLKQKIVPRTRAKDIWRIPEPLLREAQKDATLLAIRDQERLASMLLQMAKFAGKAIQTTSQRPWKVST